MTYLSIHRLTNRKNRRKNPAFKDKSGDIKRMVTVGRNLCDTLYAQQYFANFGVYYDIVDPTQ